MKFVVCLLVFSMAIALVLANPGYYKFDDANDEYDDEEETDLTTTNEDQHLSLFDVLERFQQQETQQQETPMTEEKRGPKSRGSGKGRKGKSKVGACWMNKNTYCQICNFKYPASSHRRYVLCGGGGGQPNIYAG